MDTVRSGSQDNKRMGTLYEHLFIAEALRRELQPHVPVGDYFHHDALVYGASGACIKVQVKGTSTCSFSDYGERRKYTRRQRFRITNKIMTPSGYTHLRRQHADVLAAYVAPWDYWYIIPVEAITSKCIWLYPDNKDSAGQYEKYRNEWNLFNEEENHTP